MGETTGIHDWELLHGAVSPTAAAADAFVGVEGDADGAIKSDYFALKSGQPYTRRASSNGDPELGSLPESDKPTWVDPDFDSRFLGESGFPRADPGGFWPSDESSDGQESPPPPDHAKGDLAGGFNLPSESALKGVDTEEMEGKDVAEGGSEGSGEPLKGPNTDLGNQTVAGGDKAWMGWWKLPVEILKFCAFRIKPFGPSLSLRRWWGLSYWGGGCTGTSPRGRTYSSKLVSTTRRCLNSWAVWHTSMKHSQW